MNGDAEPLGRGSDRRSLLTAALGFLALEWRGEIPEPAKALHRYLDSWRGVGGVVDAMRAEGFRLVHLSTVDDEIWRANLLAQSSVRVRRFRGGADAVGAVQQAPWRAINHRANAAYVG